MGPVGSDVATGGRRTTVLLLLLLALLAPIAACGPTASVAPAPGALSLTSPAHEHGHDVHCESGDNGLTWSTARTAAHQADAAASQLLAAVVAVIDPGRHFAAGDAGESAHRPPLVSGRLLLIAIMVSLS